MAVVKITVQNSSEGPVNKNKKSRKVLTPTDIERSCSWKAICHNFYQIEPSGRAKRLQERLHGCCPDTEKDKDIDDQKLVVSCHYEVMECRKGLYRMSLFRDKQKDEGYKKSEQGNEQSGYEGLKDFALPCMMVQITFLPGT